MKIIKRYHSDLLNGPGLREVVFVSGCNHKCPGCFNPETWNPDMPGLGAKEFDDLDLSDIKEKLQDPWISGLTWTGGDPMFPGNRETVLSVSKELKKVLPGKTIWMWTGYQIEQLLHEGLDLSSIDVIVDGEYKKELGTPKPPLRGSWNQRIIDVKETLLTGKIKIYE